MLVTTRLVFRSENVSGSMSIVTKVDRGEFSTFGRKRKDPSVLDVAREKEKPDKLFLNTRKNE